MYCTRRVIANNIIPISNKTCGTYAGGFHGGPIFEVFADDMKERRLIEDGAFKERAMVVAAADDVDDRMWCGTVRLDGTWPTGSRAFKSPVMSSANRRAYSVMPVYPKVNAALL